MAFGFLLLSCLGAANLLVLVRTFDSEAVAAVFLMDGG